MGVTEEVTLVQVMAVSEVEQVLVVTEQEVTEQEVMEQEATEVALLLIR